MNRPQFTCSTVLQIKFRSLYIDQRIHHRTFYFGRLPENSIHEVGPNLCIIYFAARNITKFDVPVRAQWWTER